MEYHVPPQVARDELRGVCYGLSHERRARCLLELFLSACDGVADVRPRVSEGRRGVSFLQNVPYRLNALCRCTDAQRFKVNVDGIAQIHPLRQLATLNKVQCDAVRDRGQIRVRDVCVGKVGELC